MLEADPNFYLKFPAANMVKTITQYADLQWFKKKQKQNQVVAQENHNYLQSWWEISAGCREAK